MIYTVTFNPALDYVVYLDKLEVGETNRSGREALYYGGKGINVSLVLRELGLQSVALGFVAGFTGDALENHLNTQGIQTEFIHLTHGLTRINVKLKAGAETEINAGGPPIEESAMQALMQKLDRLAAGDTLVLAGSIPASLPKNVYEQILKQLQGRGIRFVVDATGQLLLKVLPYRPFLVKPNHRELEEIVGRRLETTQELEQAARELRDMGAQNVLVSRGKEGALLVDETGTTSLCAALEGKAENTVGAGDSMVAGFLAGVSKGYAYALQLGNAAGAATAFQPGLAKREDILNCMEK